MSKKLQQITKNSAKGSERTERRSQALRSNLKRRKTQTRERQSESEVLSNSE